MIGTTLIVRMGRARYAWVTLLPLSFVATTTVVAGIENVFDSYLPMAAHGQLVVGYLNAALVVFMLLSLISIILLGARRCLETLNGEGPVLDQEMQL